MIPTTLRGKIIGASAGGVMAVTVAFIAWFEGTEHTAYLDPVGIWTACVGHTATVTPGRTYTDAECMAFLESDLKVAAAPVDRLVRVPLGDATRVALVSFVFNVGAGAFERSTLLRRLNAGHGAMACDELLRWVYAGGRELPGLVNRRRAERELCIEGFAAPANENRPAPIPLARPERRAA